MLKLPESGIIIAPASLHLLVYEEIYRQKGNNRDLQVLSLSSYIQRFFSNTEKEECVLWFEMLERLHPLSQDNVFALSKSSFDFIRDTLQFLRYIKTYGLSSKDLPQATQKEKALKEVLTLLDDLDIKEKQIPAILTQTIDASDVSILDHEFSLEEQLWVSFLIKNGAALLTSEKKPSLSYWSCANARKQAQVIADTILKRQYDAQDVCVVTEEASQKQVLAQIFDYHQIPYTFLSEMPHSSMITQFKACLEWIYHKDTEHFIALTEACFKTESETLTAVLKQFPFLLEKMEDHLPERYQENQILNEYRYQKIKGKVKWTLEWLNEHKDMLHWSIQDMEEILLTLQKVNTPTLENQKAFYTIQNTLALILDKVQTKEDLAFLIDMTDSLAQNTRPDTLQGVLIINRNEITPCRDVVFLTNAHAKAFPNYAMHRGIYDETYCSKLKLPSLKERLALQKEQLFHTLSLPQQLYILLPESNYDGKENPSSHELEAWLGKEPEFQDVQDPSIYEAPLFSLSKENARSLFFKEDTFSGSISQLESFARCPLQHFLRYGLHLQEKQDLMDIRIQGSIYHHILERLIREHGKDYPHVHEDQLLSLIREEFSFVMKMYPQNAALFEAQSQSFLIKMKKVLRQLSQFEANWHMQTHEQEYALSMSLNWEGTPVHLYGYIDRIDLYKSAFVIFDYKSSDKDISIQDFHTGCALQLITYTIAYEKMSGHLPYGCFYISLKTTPESTGAIKISYKKKIPEIMETEFTDILPVKKFNGLEFQDLSIYCDEKGRFARKKEQPEYTQIKEEWKTVLFSLLEDIQSGNITPEHNAFACDYCAYKEICRQSAIEVKKTNRLEKEEDHAI